MIGAVVIGLLMVGAAASLAGVWQTVADAIVRCAVCRRAVGSSDRVMVSGVTVCEGCARKMGG